MNNMPESKLNNWFEEEMFDQYFPDAKQDKSNQQYSYKFFIKAASYFPAFGRDQHGVISKRDVAAFIAHVDHETAKLKHWFQQVDGVQALQNPDDPSAGNIKRSNDINNCKGTARSDVIQERGFDDYYYCSKAESDIRYPCGDNWFFGRGPLQLSWNYNYGKFQKFLKKHPYVHFEYEKDNVLKNPNLIITHEKLPLAFMSALWFYMKPQRMDGHKKSMHDIIMEGGDDDKRRLLNAFNKTSRIINGGKEKREQACARIKAYIYYCEKFDIRAPDLPDNCSADGL